MTNSDYPEEILESLQDYNIDIRDFLPGHGSGAKLLLDFNKIKGVIPTGTGLVPFGNVQQRIVATATSGQTLSRQEREAARRQVERYARSLR